MTDPLKKYVQDHREEFDTIEAPDEMFDRIMSKMENSTPPVGKTRSIFPMKTWAIAASVAVIVSLGIFNLWQEKEIDKTIAQGKIKTRDEDFVDILNQKNELITAKIKTTKQEAVSKILANNSSDSPKQSINNQNSIANYNTENENHSDKASAIELINNEFSASSRLQGIALVKSFSAYDSIIIDLLSEKAISDENTNVRLAAVSALEMQRQNPVVTDRIQQIFVQQNDAMVQKELITFLSEKQPSELSPEVNTKLLALAKDPTTVDFVKDEAYAVIMKY